MPSLQLAISPPLPMLFICLLLDKAKTPTIVQSQSELADSMLDLLEYFDESAWKDG